MSKKAQVSEWSTRENEETARWQHAWPKVRTKKARSNSGTSSIIGDEGSLYLDEEGKGSIKRTGYGRNVFSSGN
jgi:hypothetical protein